MDSNDDITIERDGREEDGMSEVELEERESNIDHKLAKAKKELEAAKQESKEHLDGWQRAKADYVNALKRFEADRSAAKDDGVAKAVKALMPAYDALARAKEHGEIPEGFDGIARQLETAFTALGVTELGIVGEPFDPVRHEALGTDVTEDAAMDDHVTAVLEKGYLVGQTVLRPARVRVAHYEQT
ncbi:MAG TPA: nucleotide exchange factor GrpE [Candidatus Paceibacterota bacterium]|nr:nucleotide exchange factor GrpE [Candidatus Paceibacterota bacterium]